ncbi:hypothetical protein GAP32_086 [Cronobacter phage vB_CsaM_GAP32]|uniref:Uncharacterized protein n=1 Tax=Cronobacter phage vB_CsaM_GAP32 TaxID=1141136 RepID=K4FB11_9CAUD|nr:hypothetical protein GAP32_086 [Cronobacter phage vB_CsaM_GAP32]AFC21534.1 hypothetical protein GAP32_086 [Cronobacter phage vB_CsaM_GAP32]
MNKNVYLFYYTSYEIVDHDEDGAVYEDVRYNLSAFVDLKKGLEYYKSKYPSKSIQYESIIVMDFNEE